VEVKGFDICTAEYHHDHANTYLKQLTHHRIDEFF
jgi:hypothetical protein